MVLVVVQVVAAFERLEELGLAGIFRRLAVGHREVALLDVGLLHFNNHVINGGDVVVRVMIGEFGLGSLDSGASGDEGSGDCDRSN